MLIDRFRSTRACNTFVAAGDAPAPGGVRPWRMFGCRLSDSSCPAAVASCCRSRCPISISVIDGCTVSTQLLIIIFYAFRIDMILYLQIFVHTLRPNETGIFDTFSERKGQIGRESELAYYETSIINMQYLWSQYILVLGNNFFGLMVMIIKKNNCFEIWIDCNIRFIHSLIDHNNNGKTTKKFTEDSSELRQN